jgi:hypothetical protein
MLLGMYADEIVREGDGALAIRQENVSITYMQSIVASGKVLRQFSCFSPSLPRMRQ